MQSLANKSSGRKSQFVAFHEVRHRAVTRVEPQCSNVTMLMCLQVGKTIIKAVINTDQLTFHGVCQSKYNHSHLYS